MKSSFQSVRFIVIVAVVIVAALGGRPSLTAERLLQPASVQAQPANESPLAAAQRLTKAAGGNLSVRYSEATGVARFVRTTNDATIPLSGSATSVEDKAYAFFEQYGAVFGVVAPRTQLEVSKVTTDEVGSDVRMAQRYNGLPVFNAELIAHFDPTGALTSVNGTFLPGLKVSTQPRINATAAVGQTINAVGALLNVDLDLLKTSTPELGVTMSNLAQDKVGRQALVWKTTVTGRPEIRQFVYIDAINGGVVENFNGVPHGLHRENYNMLGQSNYDLAVPCRVEGQGRSLEPDCDNAFTYSGDTYNFFWNGFRRDSFDNQGSPLKSYVHYGSTICPNAFWNGQFMTYCSTFPHDDVAGHEIAHGVTEFSANLVYAYQPGALNESFSDIFGEAIDLLNSSENELGSRWKIGEGIAPVGLRDMSNPESPLYGNPDSCGSDLYHCDTSDSGGVHINSGVPNKAFVLMVDGGSLNGVNVTGIGLTKALAIHYRTLTRYLSVYSNFVDDYEALQASCRDLRNKRLTDPDPETGGGVSTERISKADCIQVKNALDAVEMTKAVCTDVGPTTAGPLCGSGETVASLYHEDHETGSTGWTASNDASLYTAQNWTVATDFVASGTRAWHINNELTSCSGGDYTSDVYLVSPNVNLAGTSRPVLRFVHDFFTEAGYDGGTVEVSVNGSWVKLTSDAFELNGYNGEISGAPNTEALDAEAFTGYRNPGSFPNLTYSESRVDLSEYVAQDTDDVVQFRFRFGTDYCNGTDVGWYLDDVEVYECKLP